MRLSFVFIMSSLQFHIVNVRIYRFIEAKVKLLNGLDHDVTHISSCIIIGMWFILKNILTRVLFTESSRVE